jgi:hypothetical protein
MASSKRSKKYSVVMCSASNRRRACAVAFYLLAAVPAMGLSPHAFAESGVVNASGAGRDTSEAIANLLKVTVAKYFKDQPQAYLRSILSNEILPNASSFVQSYKLAEGARPGLSALNASVDLDVIHGLLNLTPKTLGSPEGAKVLVVVKGAKLPESVLAALKSSAKPVDPYAPLAAAARERLARRQFGEAEVAAEDLSALGAGEDVSSPETLRGLGAKAGARLAMAVTSRYETFENENAHNKEERIVLSAVLLDVNNGVVLSRSSVNVVNPKSRRDQYVADLQRSLADDAKDLFQDLLVGAGRKLTKPEGPVKFSLVRVKFPPTAALVARFRAMLESMPGVKSVVEYEIRRGAYDFAIRPALEDGALAKAVGSLQSPELAIAIQPAMPEESGEKAAVTVKIEPKEEAKPMDSPGKASNAKP